MISAIVCNVIGLTIGSVAVKFLTGDSWQDAAKNWFATVMGAISVWFGLYMTGRTW